MLSASFTGLATGVKRWLCTSLSSYPTRVERFELRTADVTCLACIPTQLVCVTNSGPTFALAKVYAIMDPKPKCILGSYNYPLKRSRLVSQSFCYKSYKLHKIHKMHALQTTPSKKIRNCSSNLSYQLMQITPFNKVCTVFFL
jgi:hypothetical protein